MADTRLAYLEADLNALKAQGIYRTMYVLESPQGSTVRMNGKQVITLSTNNYLGFNTHPRLCAAARQAIDDYGVGSGAVRTIAGNMLLHEELEARLATFKHTEAALMFQNGYMTNVGVITSVVGDGDAIISDELNHASIIDGCRLSRGTITRYAHANMNALEDVLKATRSAPHRLVITDGVFSMDGDITPLPDIVALAERYNAAVMVDDAHASGVLGRNGRGTVDHYGLHGRVDIQVGTLSKAIGAVGGYVAGPQILREILIQRARPFLFTTSQPPSVAASCLAALDVLESEPELLDRLWENTRFFKEGLRQLGFDTGRSQTPITPVLVGDEHKTVRLSEQLFEEGVFALGIYFPMVARGQARIRTIVTAGHTREELGYCLDAFGRIGRDLGII
ncbi:MAG: glycine C-acetyltransferase [Chloroflexi bacterium]|nr:glycine C-acetyltransferase [Chloroflexota bacterium]